MFSMNLRRLLSVTAVAAAIGCVALPQAAVATLPAKGAPITYTATGTFAYPAVSGADQLKLAGQQFTITVLASSSDQPVSHGPNWAVFRPLKLSGVVYTGLIPNTPIPIGSKSAALELTAGTSSGIFQAGSPITVEGIGVNMSGLHSAAGRDAA